jgi:hypothetical protein
MAKSHQVIQDVQKRHKIFAQAKVPALEHLALARVTMNRPLVDGDYLFVMTADDPVSVSVGRGEILMQHQL